MLAHFRSCSNVSKVALWGRSMGAATAVLYIEKDPSIAGLVLDSAFSRCAYECVTIVSRLCAFSGGRS
jgi:pimeloyl-ACP methyl ester carboxylesterase